MGRTRLIIEFEHEGQARTATLAVELLGESAGPLESVQLNLQPDDENVSRLRASVRAAVSLQLDAYLEQNGLIPLDDVEAAIDSVTTELCGPQASAAQEAKFKRFAADPTHGEALAITRRYLHAAELTQAEAGISWGVTSQLPEAQIRINIGPWEVFVIRETSVQTCVSAMTAPVIPADCTARWNPLRSVPIDHAAITCPRDRAVDLLDDPTFVSSIRILLDAELQARPRLQQANFHNPLVETLLFD